MNYPQLDEVVKEITDALPTTIEADEVAMWHDTATLLLARAKNLSDAAGIIEAMCAEAVPREKGAVVESGGRTFARTGKANRKEWQTDDLVRVVDDSRVFSPVTGELLTLADKIRKVWNLGAPRVTALAELGIDPDEFCTTEWTNRGVKEIVTDTP